MNTDTSDPSTLPTLDIAGADFVTDPHRANAEALARSWVAQSERGLEILSFDGCNALMGDTRLVPGIQKIVADMGISADQAGPFTGGRSMLLSEGADHDAVRKAIYPWFSSERVAGLRGTARSIAERAVDAATADGFDMHRDISVQLPPALFCSMIAVDDRHVEQLYDWSVATNELFNLSTTDLGATLQAIGELVEFVQQLMADRRRHPGDDLASFVVGAAADGAISDTDAGALLVEALVASSDNTSITASLLAHSLATHPNEWRKLRRDPALIGAAVEEGMRMEPRVMVLYKVAIDDIEHRDLTIPAGSNVFFHLSSAHRDPAAYPDPHRFSVTRSRPKRQLVFGRGRHHCIGALLARMEISELLAVMIDRFSTIEPMGAPSIRFGDSINVDTMPMRADRVSDRTP